MAVAPTGILFTNDDGPPDVRHSPFIIPFAAHIARAFPDAKLFFCVPASQQSFVGKGISRKPIRATFHSLPRFVAGQPNCPQEYLDTLGGVSQAVYSTVDGTPATAANIALEHIPPFPIDLVLSGPNFGQNAGTAFISCSGTVGAALESALQGFRSVSLSFGYSRPSYSTDEIAAACGLATDVIVALWGHWPSQTEAELYNVNIPLGCARDAPVYTTRIHHERSYGNLFVRTSVVDPAGDEWTPEDDAKVDAHRSAPPKSPRLSYQDSEQVTMSFECGQLKFDPEAPPGTDRWALNQKVGSVTPMTGAMAVAGISSSPFPLAQT